MKASEVEIQGVLMGIWRDLSVKAEETEEE